jgi:hypothetical protein
MIVIVGQYGHPIQQNGDEEIFKFFFSKRILMKKKDLINEEINKIHEGNFSNDKPLFLL